MKALVATDGSLNAIDAARSARSLLDPDTELLLVTVIPRHEEAGESAGGFEGPVLSEEEAAEWAAQATAAGQAALEDTAAALGIGATLELIESDNAGAEICDAAERVGADVLVIGGSEKGLLRRLFTGSVMHYLVHHAPCPVLVVRHAD
jgi:nucleotide-binding universal stress UspA family protein